jgi:hypothetical protein
VYRKKCGSRGENPHHYGWVEFDLVRACRQGERTCSLSCSSQALVVLLAGGGASRPCSRPGRLGSIEHGLRAGKVCGSRTCKPNSVCGIAPAGRSFLWAAHYCGAQATYPEVVTRRAGTFSWGGVFTPSLRSESSSLRTPGPSLFGLAPCGVCPARRITAAAVRSYRTFSPLPRRCRRGGMFSVALAVNRA